MLFYRAPASMSDLLSYLDLQHLTSRYSLTYSTTRTPAFDLQVQSELLLYHDLHHLTSRYSLTYSTTKISSICPPFTV